MDRFILKRENAALAIVDIQDKLAVVMSEKQKVLNNTIHLIETAKLLKIPILITEQYPKGLGPTIAGIKEALENYDPIEKTSFSCCGESTFLTALAGTGRKQIIIAGMETHVCVLQTCLDLLRNNFIVHIVSDAVCSRTKDNFKAGIELMRDAGAAITSTETVLFQLLEKAGTEEFRTISKRIK
ncbi:MAG: hydrolase [Nitrospirota bacterium]